MQASTALNIHINDGIVIRGLGPASTLTHCASIPATRRRATAADTAAAAAATSDAVRRACDAVRAASHAEICAVRNESHAALERIEGASGALAALHAGVSGVRAALAMESEARRQGDVQVAAAGAQAREAERASLAQVRQPACVVKCCCHYGR
jgi:hypothetical protein